VYRTLTYDHPNQLLVNADIPSFNFDTIYGIEYCIDPTKPIGSRIVQLTYNGLTIVPDQVFMLATNQFRAAGGGNFLATPYDGPIKRSDKRLERAIHDALSTPQNRFWTSQNPWRLTADAPLSVIFETAPSALEHLNDVSHLSPHPLGTSEKGFVKIKLQLK
jgi:2',3'-cyclic-nucleotide 2'-phosphodiesterase/3'-nucleotidase